MSLFANLLRRKMFRAKAPTSGAAVPPCRYELSCQCVLCTGRPLLIGRKILWTDDESSRRNSYADLTRDFEGVKFDNTHMREVRELYNRLVKGGLGSPTRTYKFVDESHLFNQPRKDMQIEVGKSYRTRDGRKATVLHKLAGDRAGTPFLGVISMLACDVVAVWTDFGLVVPRTLGPNDLVAPWVDETVEYMNVWRHTNSTYSSAADALHWKDSFDNFIGTLKVTRRDGEIVSRQWVDEGETA